MHKHCAFAEGCHTFLDESLQMQCIKLVRLHMCFFFCSCWIIFQSVYSSTKAMMNKSSFSQLWFTGFIIGKLFASCLEVVFCTKDNHLPTSDCSTLLSNPWCKELQEFQPRSSQSEYKPCKAYLVLDNNCHPRIEVQNGIGIPNVLFSFFLF